MSAFLMFCMQRPKLLLEAASTEALVEAIHSTTGLSFFLLTSVERVTLTANVDSHCALFHSRASCHYVTARTVEGNFVVLWVDTSFHSIKPLCFMCRHLTLDAYIMLLKHRTTDEKFAGKCQGAQLYAGTVRITTTDHPIP